jgi:large subunit ribosomal protein L21
MGRSHGGQSWRPLLQRRKSRPLRQSRSDAGAERGQNMFAVIKTGGKQYRVAPDDLLRVEKVGGAVGETVVFPEILMVGGDAGVTIGSPLIEGASVAAEIVEQMRDDKVIAFKKRRRQNSKRRRGHRQHLTLVKIAEILTQGAKPSKAAKPKAEARAAEPQPAEPKPAEAAEAKRAAEVAKAASTETGAKPAKAAPGEIDASNLSLISGIGPTIEKKLRGAGITSWNDIAAWSEADIARWDEELSLRGRATREEWVQQAKELLAGKPPRAKADQAEKASGKDL